MSDPIEVEVLTASTVEVEVGVGTGDRGPQGEPGPAAALTMGTVTTGAAGTDASATISGTAPNQTLSLVIPRGDDGADGVAGATGAQGDDGREVELQASATHLQWRYAGESTWTDLVALSAITGPQGVQGVAGEAGPAGAQGAAGSQGPQGDPGPANTLSIGTVTSGGAASATITGTAPSQTLNLVLPAGPAGADGQDGADVEFQSSATHLQWRYAGGSTWYDLVALAAITGPSGPAGATGSQGAAGPAGAVGATGSQGPQGNPGPANSLSIGTVTSGATASATITGVGPSQTLNLVLPQGATGATGPAGPSGGVGIGLLLALG